MPRINLLPWRDTQKREREIQFAIVTGVSLAIAGLVVLGVHLYMEGEISYQEARNQYLQSEIVLLDKQIKEIEDLEKTRNNLIQRIEVIQKLETDRNKPVYLVNELVTRVPDGVYFSEMEQKSDVISLKGSAQSDARVASLMRALDDSEWLETPRIKLISTEEDQRKKTQLVGASANNSLNAFELTIKQTQPKKDDTTTSSSTKKPAASPAAKK